MIECRSAISSKTHTNQQNRGCLASNLQQTPGQLRKNTENYLENITLSLKLIHPPPLRKAKLRHAMVLIASLHMYLRLRDGYYAGRSPYECDRAGVGQTPTPKKVLNKF